MTSSAGMRTLHCELLDTDIRLPERPQRIVSLSSGFTEALDAMGLLNRIAGISSYCHRYFDAEGIPVVGDYLKYDEQLFKDIEPDLVLITSGLQIPLGRRLARAGWPVFALPLPSSYWGIVENIVNLGILTGNAAEARNLAYSMQDEAGRLSAERAQRLQDSGGHKPRVYPELWFGLHGRTIGARSFISDIIRLAGALPLYEHLPESYIKLDFERVAQEKPEVFLGFHEPEFPVDFHQESINRAWSEPAAPARPCNHAWSEPAAPASADLEAAWNPRIIVSDVQKGRNIIHDGPSILQTARWLADRLDEL